MTSTVTYFYPSSSADTTRSHSSSQLTPSFTKWTDLFRLPPPLPVIYAPPSYRARVIIRSSSLCKNISRASGGVQIICTHKAGGGGGDKRKKIQMDGSILFPPSVFHAPNYKLYICILLFSKITNLLHNFALFLFFGQNMAFTASTAIYRKF